MPPPFWYPNFISVALSVSHNNRTFFMALALGIPQSFLCRTSNGSKIKLCSNISDGKTSTSQTQTKKRCLRCNTLYTDKDNSPTACSFHGHTTGEKGLFAMAPPHQGIDGEWSDRSGVIVYRWNEKSKRPDTGSGNWKKRWSCCQEYDENATPCQRGCHVSYDDGFTLY
ncbi:PREDICTED: uncharacterized protein LOC103330465 [Prunus mume]|uniref:Uncharacterized protein LOC103330465 n=1 Tax=Prunus mume TaxID=102107 RepID=A0ABM0NXI6_PRUMU|nr:PREDICTED: uncharacterized protein LOC103330465 [Prunus mume]